MLLRLEWYDNWAIYQTDDSIDYKQSFIIRSPGGMAPRAMAFFVPLSCQSFIPELYYLKSIVTGICSGK